MNLVASWGTGFLNNTTNLGNTTTAFNSFLLGAAQGRAYLNIHSTVVPGGEIRGFLVPEPASLALLGIGLLGVSAMRRKRLA